MRAIFSDEQLVTAVERHNAMVRGLNKAMPDVLKAINGSPVTGEKVGKRVRDQISEIMDKAMPKEPWARWWLDREYTYSVYLMADFTAHVSEFSVHYFKFNRAIAENKDGIWIALDFTPFETVTVKQIKTGIAKAEEAERRAKVAIDKSYDAKRKVAGFIHD